MKKLNQIIFLILMLSQTSMFGQGTGEMFPFSSYKEFDTEGGYYPGSFVVIKKKSVQAPIITRERLDQVVCKKKLLEYSKPQDIPNTTLDRKKTFQTSLDVGVKYQGIDPEVKGQLQKAKNITLNVKKGKRYFVGSGTIAIQDVLYALPLEDLTKIKFELANKRKVLMIAEVIEYDDAELVFKWDKAIEAGLKVQIPQVVKLGTDNMWTDNATLVVKFAPGQLVGYKAVEIGKSYKKLIDERIKFRQSSGDDKCMFIDKDVDGFGDANSESKGIPANTLANFPNYVENQNDIDDNDKFSNRFFLDKDKDGQGDINNYKYLSKITEGYVKNADDPDDNDRYNVKGAKLWYVDKDNDGYGDPNPELGRYGITQPKGFVSNDRDCYDDNSDAFPGQTKFFTSHRGDNSWDYNCDGSSEKRFIQIGGCDPRCSFAEPAGWENKIPACGVEGSWLGDCDYIVQVFPPNASCFKRYERKVQECR